MFITESTTKGATYTRTEYSTSANKLCGQPAAIFENNLGTFTAAFGRYRTDGDLLEFVLSPAHKSGRYKTEAGALRAINKYIGGPVAVVV